MDWWRAHHGISNDAKLAVVSVRAKSKRCEVGWVWVILLDYASQNEHRGSTVGLDNEQIAIMADLPVEQVSEIIGQLAKRGLIQQDGTLTAWEKRQPSRERQDDNSTERSRRFREKQRHATPCNASDGDATPGNAQIREEEIREEKSNPQTPAPNGAGSHTRAPRKGKRTTDQIRAALGPERLVWWENFWRVYPEHDGMNDGMDAFERRVKDHDLAVDVWKGAKAYAAKCAADPALKKKFSQGWINSERWKDENLIPPPTPNGKKKDFVANVTEVMQRNMEEKGRPW